MPRKIGKSSTWKDIQIGRWVHLDEKTVRYLNSVFSQEDVAEHRAYEGFYQITDIEQDFHNPPNTPEVAKVQATIYLKHENWRSPHAKSMPIVINPFCSIILAGAILMPDSIKTAITSVDELIAANKDQFHCTFCGKPLNVITVNLRICKDCEESFSEENPLTNDDDPANIYVEDEDTLELF
jgi:hypothetical protein